MHWARWVRRARSTLILDWSLRLSLPLCMASLYFILFVFSFVTFYRSHIYKLKCNELCSMARWRFLRRYLCECTHVAMTLYLRWALTHPLHTERDRLNSAPHWKLCVCSAQTSFFCFLYRFYEKSNFLAQWERASERRNSNELRCGNWWEYSMAIILCR